jgi:hypothetical protein
MSTKWSQTATSRIANSPYAMPEAARFLERAGLLPGRGCPPVADVEPEPGYFAQLEDLRRVLDLGLAVHQLRELLSASGVEFADVAEFRESVSDQIESVEAKIVALMKVRQTLLELEEKLETGHAWLAPKGQLDADQLCAD